MKKNKRELIDQYIEYVRQKGHCQETASINRKALEELAMFLQLQRKKKELREVSKEDMEEFVLYLKGRKSQTTNESLSVSHKNRTLSTAKSFFNFLASREYIMTDIAAEIDLLKEEKRIPRDIMTESEVKEFLSVINRKTLTGKRDYCMFRAFYHTGIRKSELIDLGVCDIDFDEGVIFVKGKFSKRRYVPLAENIANIMKKYLKEVRPILVRDNPGQERVFTTTEGSTFSKNTIPAVCGRYAQKARIDKHITTHSFRHTFATHMLNRGASIRHIQEILGHEELSTTEIYTRVTIKDLKQVYDRTHPRAVIGMDWQIDFSRRKEDNVEHGKIKKKDK